MTYIFQTGTDMLYFTCAYFFQLILYLTMAGAKAPTNIAEKTFIFAFVVLLFFFFIIKMIKRAMQKKEMQNKKIFHPASTLRQRFAAKLLLCILFFFLASVPIAYIYNAYHIVFVFMNIVSIFSILLTFMCSLFFESVPDKNDCIRFDENQLYYYMRVIKDVKSKKFMNSYIIPYEAIKRSYIIRNVLYIEIDRSHPKVQIAREFSTNSKRIAISFKDYPGLKSFVSKKENIQLLKIKEIKNIEYSDYI